MLVLFIFSGMSESPGARYGHTAQLLLAGEGSAGRAALFVDRHTEVKVVVWITLGQGQSMPSICVQSTKSRYITVFCVALRFSLSFPAYGTPERGR